MSREQVLKVESGMPLAERDKSLFFDDVLVGCHCIVTYDFDEEGRLCSGSYAFDHHDDLVDVDAFLSLDKMLRKKYGEPESRQFQWKDPYRARKLETNSELAKAVGIGDMTVRFWWRAPETLIRLILAEDRHRYNALLYLFYDELKSMDARYEREAARDIELI